VPTIFSIASDAGRLGELSLLCRGLCRNRGFCPLERAARRFAESAITACGLASERTCESSAGIFGSRAKNAAVMADEVMFRARVLASGIEIVLMLIQPVRR